MEIEFLTLLTNHQFFDRFPTCECGEGSNTVLVMQRIREEGRVCDDDRIGMVFHLCGRYDSSNCVVF